MTTETVEEAFARGQATGEVNARLNHHEARLGAHDIAIAAIGPQMVSLTSSIQELRADLRERKTTADALEKSDDRRRKDLDEKDEQRRKRADEAREALDLADEERAKRAARKALPVTRGLAYLAAGEGVLVTWLGFMQATGKG